MASTYLQKVPSSAGSTTTGTFSFWVKIAGTGTQAIYTVSDGSSQFDIYIRNSSGQLDFYAYNGSSYTFRLHTSRLLKDPNAWYHIVCKIDLTNSTQADRAILYINGVRETAYSIETYPSDASQTAIFSKNSTTTIGASHTGGNDLDGVLSHFHFCDGYAYDASTFGETDSTTGEWKINTNPSVSYGTNGFFLFKDNASTTDQSGQGNNWSVTAGTLTKTEDSPSNIFATLNSRYNSAGNFSFANSNTNYSESQNQWKTTFSTLGASSGKYYAEFKAKGNYYMIGVADYNVTKSGTADRNFASTTYISEQGYGYYNGNGDLYYRGSSTSYGATYGNGDIVQVALDCDNNRVFFGKNGTWQNSADPTTASTGFAMTAQNATYVFAVAVQNNNLDCNFGNGYFGTTAVSSAGTNSGIGTFEYDVPSGYKALCTKNINAQEYS